MAWSAEQYAKFEDERTRPARDLLAQVPLGSVTRAYDLGCGPGNSTELIAARFGAASVAGIDSDDNMLAAAAKRLPGTQFTKADLNTWVPEEPADLLYANAVFQWVPDHISVLARLMDHLRPGGVLAVQMPDNLSEPSHVLMEETGAAGPWKAAFEGGRVRRAVLPPPAVYFDRLMPKSVRVDVWHTVYYHPLADAPAIVEWVRATGLRPYLDAAGLAHAQAFAADYTARIADAYPPMADGRVLLRFPRLFVIAVKA
ncbi:trans-aconitate 2-methyltransferase [Neorhizobium galegae]|uniref:trans-aconitate 2-methyltransferase n=1 Tax=Neorhizobium galegae TaxID=399 RepID=UPI00062252B5|nr:trans-aconitate 2-methyltransferase [Neorhizobium galegae]CDZ29551.1 Trans-aconitate methyltransferase [Neorhizobium galegae bv. officinalis]KAA9386300.1 trans-aconitate 2-methyltransferase [Neorhizobium galegae]KAB1112844.1 trans-aconitate 2-methyltransferase [Neorhizobium galegae]MCM2500706.1 trans-aconitate 2-methyltransferase [Neorhizobium galegae]MCQ1770665.1 trans-aconitate 2-methyltransferase [Neorhizobium galegae]